MKKIIFIILLLFNSAVLADVNANAGDVRVFVSPQAINPMKVRLLTQTNKQLFLIANETPLLQPAQYYTFTAQSLNKLTNQTIYIQLYNFAQKQWAQPIVLITQYQNNTTPFYQFSCWFEGTPVKPLCWGAEQG
jgi:hypothetical protein